MDCLSKLLLCASVRCGKAYLWLLPSQLLLRVSRLEILRQCWDLNRIFPTWTASTTCCFEVNASGSLTSEWKVMEFASPPEASGFFTIDHGQIDCCLSKNWSRPPTSQGTRCGHSRICAHRWGHLLHSSISAFPWRKGPDADSHRMSKVLHKVMRWAR